MFDVQGSADVLVRDPDSIVDLFVSKLDFPAPKPRWIHDWPERGYKAVHCRVNPTVREAPTTVEVIGPGPYQPEDPHNAAYFALQSPRPMMTHGTVVGTDDFEELVNRLRSRGVPFRHHAPQEVLAAPVIWPGVTYDPFRYDPTYDGGLFLEIIPLSAFRLPEGTADTPVVPECEEGAVVRVLSRAFLVDDIYASLKAVETNIGWTSDAPVVEETADGCLQAFILPTIRTSSALELLQPLNPDLPIGQYYGTFGAGVHRLRFAVRGLDAKAAALDARDVHYVHSRLDDGRERLAVDPEELQGIHVEFLEVG